MRDAGDGGEGQFVPLVARAGFSRRSPPRLSRASRSFAAVALAALMVALSNVIAAAQVTTPAQGSPLRAAILDAVRPRVEAEVGKPVEFVVRQLRVLGEWAFADLTPQRPGGGAIEYVYSRYQRARDSGAFDNQVVALLRNTPRGWLLYEYALGATDVAWYGWWTAYPVPEQVFPPH